MKAAILSVLVLIVTGCAHVNPARSEPKSHVAVRDQLRRETPMEKWERMLLSPEIEQRTKSYEKKGLSPEEARAAAEIEYFRSGR